MSKNLGPAAPGGDVQAFLDQVKSVDRRRGTTAGTGRGRLIFALDATASREPTWVQARALQNDMFAAAALAGGLDVQLVYFRGFDECKASPWVDDPARMIRYMGAIDCLGGHTQIGKVLAHARDQAQQAPVNALVYVGDALEEPVDNLARLAGELGLLKLPIFLFHEGGEPSAAAAFHQFAKLSGGAYFPFDRSSAEHLRQLLGAVAAYAAGGRSALSDFNRRTGGAVAGLLAQLS